MNKKVYFRADASNVIGYGHFVRTLALADMLKDNFDCKFFTQDPTKFQESQMAKVCSYQALPSDESKFNRFLEYLNGDEIVVLDNYFFATDYQQSIKGKGCNLVCIDDLHNKHFVADAVINHSLGIKKEDYSKESYTQLFLGLDYSLLRKPFLDALSSSYKSDESPKKMKVLVSFGGADVYNIARNISTQLSSLDNIEGIDLITIDKSLATISPKVSCHINLSAEQMKNLICKNDIAVIPSSTIMKEAIACGINIVGGYFAENQLNSYTQFYKYNAIQGFGDLRDAINIANLVKFFSSGEVYNMRLTKNIIPCTVKDNLKRIFLKYAY